MLMVDTVVFAGAHEALYIHQLAGPTPIVLEPGKDHFATRWRIYA